jgi:hypothetical protein
MWWDATKPAVLLSPSELEKAYVVVDGKEVRLSSIPAEERARIIQARQARRLPITEKAIAETWVRARNVRAKINPNPVPRPGDEVPQPPRRVPDSITGVRG